MNDTTPNYLDHPDLFKFLTQLPPEVIGLQICPFEKDRDLTPVYFHLEDFRANQTD